jgi:hypothetical protein
MMTNSSISPMDSESLLGAAPSLSQSQVPAYAAIQRSFSQFNTCYNNGILDNGIAQHLPLSSETPETVYFRISGYD